MLFILAIDPESLCKTERSSSLHQRTSRFNVALYADDAVVFTRPDKQELQTVQSILQCFGQATGMITNLTKSEVYAIRCDNLDLQEILPPFLAQQKNFPCTYLGLPLHIRKLRKMDVQPLIDRFSARLPKWKGRLLNKTGRSVLIKSTLSALPTYHLTVFPLKKWAEKKMDKIHRGFLWTGSEQAQGGHCLVNWKRVCRPKNMGGLGITNLEYFSRSLRLRWLWHDWTADGKPWQGSILPCDETDKQLFRASTIISLGNGGKAKFWHDKWIEGQSLKDLTPSLYQLATRKNRTVVQELQDHRWLRPLRRMNSTTQVREFSLMAADSAGTPRRRKGGRSYLEMDHKWLILSQFSI